MVNLYQDLSLTCKLFLGRVIPILFQNSSFDYSIIQKSAKSKV
jgi:hypothetical protein